MTATPVPNPVARGETAYFTPQPVYSFNRGLPYRITTRPLFNGGESSKNQLVATIGGVLELDGRIYALTVARIFPKDQGLHYRKVPRTSLTKTANLQRPLGYLLNRKYIHHGPGENRGWALINLTEDVDVENNVILSNGQTIVLNRGRQIAERKALHYIAANVDTPKWRVWIVTRPPETNSDGDYTLLEGTNMAPSTSHFSDWTVDVTSKIILDDIGSWIIAVTDTPDLQAPTAQVPPSSTPESSQQPNPSTPPVSAPTTHSPPSRMPEPSQQPNTPASTVAAPTKPAPSSPTPESSQQQNPPAPEVPTPSSLTPESSRQQNPPAPTVPAPSFTPPESPMLLGMVIDVINDDTNGLRKAVFSPLYKIGEEIQEKLHFEMKECLPKSGSGRTKYVGSHKQRETKGEMDFKTNKIDIPKTFPSSSFLRLIMPRSKSHVTPGSKLFWWQLEEEEVQKWNSKIRPTIEAIIQRSPSKSRTESTPIVVLDGLKVGMTSKLAEASPAVVICCKSRLYREQIVQLIQQSRLLDSWGFKIVAMEQPVHYQYI